MKKLLIPALVYISLLLSVLGITAAEIPTLTSDDVAYIAFHTGAGGLDTNSGLTADAPRKTLSKTLELLPDGGTVVVTNKVFIGGNYTIPARSGMLYFTSVYGNVDYTDVSLAGQDSNGLTNNVFKMAAGATLTFTSDAVLDNLILYSEYAKYNTLRVTNGATLVIGAGVECRTSPALTTPAYMAIEIESGSKVILNGGIFSSIRGEGVCINNGATICEPNPTVKNDSLAYVAYHTGAGGSDENDGLTPETPRKSFEKTLELLPDGGTVVIKKKAFINSDYTIKVKGTLLFTSKYGGVDYTETDPTNNVFKMASGKTLTFSSDAILDNLILFNEYTTHNTLRVTNGSTLVIGGNVECRPATKDASVYMIIEVEKGSTVILNGGIFDSITGEGRIINHGARIIKHTEHDQNNGLITKEPTCTESGESVYSCKTCSLTMGTETIPALRHNYIIESSGTPATCTEAGRRDTSVCSRCGNMYGGEIISPLGHSAGSWVVTRAPQPGVYGEEARYCTRCSALLNTRCTSKLPTAQEQSIIELLTYKLFKKSSYTIRFNTAGGSTLPNQTVKDGECAVIPQPPVRDGYVFDGWYSESMLWFPYDFSDRIHKNITLYAKWKPI